MKDVRITKRLVDTLKPSGAGAWETELKGFGVRVQATGAKSYVVKYSAGSGRAAPTKLYTVARVGKLTPEQARAEAKKILGRVALGEDPAAQKAADRKAETLKELIPTFLEEVKAKKKPKTHAQYSDVLNRLVLPELGTRKVNKVTTPDIARLHRVLGDHPYQANRMLAAVSAIYEYARKHHMVPVDCQNPSANVEKYPERKREKFLNNDELARLGDAIREAETTGLPYEVDGSKPKAKHAPKQENRLTVIGPHAAAAMRLLLFTGARLREILHLKWGDIDWQFGMLNLGDSKTGKKPIILNAPAIEVLSNLPRVGSYVIAGQSAGTDEEKPRSDLKRPWNAVAKRASLKRSAHSRPTPLIRECWRRRRSRFAYHWEAFGAHASVDHATVCTPRRRPGASRVEPDWRRNRCGHGRSQNRQRRKRRAIHGKGGLKLSHVSRELRQRLDSMNSRTLPATSKAKRGRADIGASCAGSRHARHGQRGLLPVAGQRRPPFWGPSTGVSGAERP
jgi:integrase